MNYGTVLLYLISLLILAACEGPTGPVGPVGPVGPDGEPGEIGFVMEWKDVDFTASEDPDEDYKVLLDFNDFEFEGLDSDISLVYFLWEVDPTTDLEVWRPLPQTLIVKEGLLQYNYDFTKFDVKLSMDADFDLNSLGANDTDDWIVRVVVVPGEFVGGRKAASIIDCHVLAERLGLPEPIRQPGRVYPVRRE